MRVTRVRFDPVRYNEWLCLAEDLTAMGGRFLGFQGSYGGVDRTSGTAVGISLWDTEEHAQFTLDAATLGDLLPRIQTLGMQMEPAEVYEEVAQHPNPIRFEGSGERLVVAT